MQKPKENLDKCITKFNRDIDRAIKNLAVSSEKLHNMAFKGLIRKISTVFNEIDKFLDQLNSESSNLEVKEIQNASDHVQKILDNFQDKIHTYIDDEKNLVRLKPRIEFETQFINKYIEVEDKRTRIVTKALETKTEIPSRLKKQVEEAKNAVKTHEPEAPPRSEKGKDEEIKPQ